MFNIAENARDGKNRFPTRPRCASVPVFNDWLFFRTTALPCTGGRLFSPKSESI
jgi:hypothetical protein